MPDIASNNKRIAKNAMMLYIRMFLVMLVSLYTVRVVLAILGEEDYGIYNVVGGIVVMFSFLSNTLASSSNRYFSYEIGKNDNVQLSRVFSISVILYFIVILLIIALSESIGLWFMYAKMTIPECRMRAAQWVYQFSILSFCVTLLATPYKSMIIAKEKMDIYAYVGILEVVLNLLLALGLKSVKNIDYLIVYSVLMFVIQVIVNSVYVLYSLKYYTASRFVFFWESKLAKEIAIFSGWNFFGAIASVIRSQGINMLLNVFFNPAINAARGLAYQVSNALNSFSTNFYTAVRPQVVKYYAQDNLEETIKLVFRSSKMTYFFMLCLSVPVIVFINPVLGIWLKDIPQHTSMFSILVIITALVDSMSLPLMTLAQATGRIRTYQSVVGTLLILNLPISYVLLKCGCSAEFTMYVAIFIAVVSLVARLFILKKIVFLSITRYCKEVLFCVFKVTIVAFIISILIRQLLFSKSDSIMFAVSFVLSLILTILVTYYLGLTVDERKAIYGFVKSKFRK